MMDFENFILPPREISTEKWQMGSLMIEEIQPNSIVLLYLSDYRGAGGDTEPFDFQDFRKEFYQLSKADFTTSICDLGSVISGKNLEDTHYILEDILISILHQNANPVVIGGGNDFSYVLFSALNKYMKNIDYSHFSPYISLKKEGENLKEDNFIHKIFTNREFSLKKFSLLGYQRHLSDLKSIELIDSVDFDVLRLSELMNTTHKAEPLFRNSNLVTLNCDAVESFFGAFSMNPSVNGLNKREICAYMKEIGLLENLKIFGLFNFNIKTTNPMYFQLLAQMIWYLLEGINIQRSHPKQRVYEKFIVLFDNQEFVFRKDTFTGHWYFGQDENIEKCFPCSFEDYENAKKGFINKRFFK